MLDCTPNKEPQEGKLIQSLFKICELYKPSRATCLYYTVASKEKSLNKLATPTKYDIIHLSAHGSSEGTGNGST